MRRAWSAVESPPVSALVVSTPANQRYLCGFTGSAGLLVLSATDRWLLTDGRYEHAAREAREAGRLAPVEIRGVTGPVEQALADVLAECPAGEIGFEAAHVTVATFEVWRRASSGRVFVPAGRPIERMRAVKDAFELTVIRRACRVLSDVALHLRDWLAAGRTERQVAHQIDASLLRAGFSQPAFPTIVASGPESAHPHARPTDRQLRDGDLVLLDFGGVLDGYCGDLTRMAAVGFVNAEARALFDAVRAAQEAALAAVRAEVLASEVDAAARAVLSLHGFEGAVRHATGHGLGLELHEAPRIGRQHGDPGERLEAGMVCTIEPGAYVQGVGGVRLEDDVIVTASGCEVLTEVPRDLAIV